MKIHPPLPITLLLLAALIMSTPVSAAPISPAEQDGWGLGLDKRTIETNWSHHNTGGETTHESFDLLGVKGEYQMAFIKVDQMSLDFNIGGILFFSGDYSGERGISTYEGDAAGFEIDAAIQAGFDTGSVSLLGRVGGSLTIIGASAAGDTAASPYDEDFTHTIPEIFGALGIKFDQFKFMGATSASLMYRFTLVDLGASTDYYISGDVESIEHSNSGIFFTLNFR